MTWISNSVTFTGLVLLAHACYSAQEHHALSATLAASTASGSPTNPSLPIDISLEAVIGTLIICFGLIFGAPTLRPIQWNVWAGKIEREGEAGFLDGSGEVDKNYRGNPFQYLEARPGFVDIRKQRKEFAEWVKGNDQK